MSDEKELTAEELEVAEDKEYSEAMAKVKKTMGMEGSAPDHEEKDKTVDIGGEDDKKSVEAGTSGEPAEGKVEQGGEDDELKRLRETVLRQAGDQRRLNSELNELKNKANVVKQPEQLDLTEGALGDTFDELQKEYPKVDFNRLDGLFKNQQQQIEQLQHNLQTTRHDFQENQHRNYQANTVGTVKQSFPDFEEMVRSKEFISWQGNLAPEAQAQVLQANDPGDIRFILESFVGATGYRSKAAQEAESMDKANETVARRDKRRSASLGLDTKQPAAPVTGGSDSVNEDAIRDKVFRDIGVRK
ncbi:MAG: hypothetical protein KAS93_08095 [Gammaproteobacteria bacterium]|nr:hypothetical protein [Gammaproteobacteria bacterium]